MGWWSYNHNMMGDSPADIMGRMFATIVERTKVENIPKPTLQELLVSLKLVINQNAEELLLEGGSIQIKKIVAYLEDKRYVVSEELNSSLIQQLAPIIYENFVECQNTYQETFERKPKLSEFLWAVVFELSTPEQYLSIEAGNSIFDIVAELEQGTIVSFLQRTEVTPTTEAATETSAPTNLEPEITFSWTEIGNNSIISHEAVNLLKQPLMALAHTYEQERGERPTVKELVDGLTAIFVHNLEEFCADSEAFIVDSLTIELSEDPYGEIGLSFDPEDAKSQLVIHLKNALLKIVKTYQKEWHRLPKLQEIIDSIKLFLFEEPLYKYLSVRGGTVVNDLFISWRKRLPSPWTDIGNNEAIHYDANNIFEEAFKGFAQAYSERQGQFPSLKELNEYITTVLRSNLGEICDNSQEFSVQRLVLMVKNRQNIVSNGGGLSPDDPLVIACRDALASLSPIYESQWHRQPRLRELLRTLESTINVRSDSFLLDADQEIYVEDIRIE